MLQDAIANPKNLGEMADADATGTVGSPECGDMVRLWLKFREEDGKKVIDRASFQSFGCQTAIAVASVATEMLKGKAVEDALSLSAGDLSEPLGALPPMKIHCGQMVEGALKAALEQETGAAGGRSGQVEPAEAAGEGEAERSPSLIESLTGAVPAAGKIKIVFDNGADATNNPNNG